MKVPANLPADRLILEYLSRVAAAGNRHLPKGKRMAFVSSTRNRIWRDLGPGGTADADRVREVLAGLGEPEDLVMAERTRLDAETAERLERQAQKKAADETAAAPPGTAPLQYRPPRSPGPGRFAHWTPGVAGARAPGGTVSPTTNGAGPHAAGGGPGAGGSDSAPGPPANGATAAAGAHQAGGTIPSGAGPAAGEETPALARGTHALRGAAATLGNGAVDLALDAAELARRHKLETAAVLLLGISAFIFVFPYWLVVALLGGVVAIWSLIWNARDKWVALAGPPVIALAGTIVAALIIGGHGQFFGSYVEAFRMYVGYAYRGGSLLCAAYLALQARRGPQRRLPPWKR